MKAGDHARALDLHQRLLALWNAMVGDKLPACVRAAQEMQGLPASRSRAPMPEASAAQRAAIAAALEGLAGAKAPVRRTG
jgi:4-hydroxy-tetrahydrodipicolinate synthase